MKTIMKRLKSKAGETLVESMAAILIFTFGSIIMLSMVSAAADINAAVRDEDQEYTNQLAYVEKAETDGIEAKVTVTLGSKSENTSVYVYRASEDSLYAYYPEQWTGGEAS